MREMSVREVQAQVAKIQECMKSLMVENTHYGHSFPGDTKKNLLKPGADKLCFMFRLRPDFDQQIRNLEGGHIEVMTRCAVYHIETGMKIADGVGLCSTMESKYRWRNAGRVCPVCGKEALIKGKAEYGGGWVCYAKKGGCGAKFRDGDPEVENQQAGKVENPDIADTYNTVLKMSKKRAYVDAVITACAASDIFTQDVEDIEPRHEGNGGGVMSTPVEKAEPPRKAAAGKTAGAANVDEHGALTAAIKTLLNSKRPDGSNLFPDDAYNKTVSEVNRTPKTEAGLASLKKKKTELEKTVAASQGGDEQEYGEYEGGYDQDPGIF
jgi:hypothetical protein